MYKYTKEDHEKIIKYFYNDSVIVTSIWGPSYWYIIHTIAKNYQQCLRIYVKAFFEYLEYILPCNVCIEGMNEFKQQNDVDKYLSSAKDLFYFTYLLHQHANERTGKHVTVPCNVIYYFFNKISQKYGHVVNFIFNVATNSIFPEEQNIAILNKVYKLLYVLLPQEHVFFLNTFHPEKTEFVSKAQIYELVIRVCMRSEFLFSRFKIQDASDYQKCVKCNKDNNK